MALLERISTGPMIETVRLRICLDELAHNVSPEMLDRFAAGAATRGERRVVIRHLLDGCSSCSRRLGSFLSFEQARESEGAYDRIFDRVLDRALAEMKAGA